MTHPIALDSDSATLVQGALWALMVVSVLLTLRAIDSETWLTMWFAALLSLAASLIAIWSIGSLIFLLTCVQLAAAGAMRWPVGWRGWTASMLAGVVAFGVIIYGLAFLRAWDLWLFAILLVFAVTSLPILTGFRLRRG